MTQARFAASEQILTERPRNNLTERRAGQVKRETRYDYAAAVAMRYQRSGREQKGWILDEFCAATGYNRKYAMKLLPGPFPRAALPPGHGRRRCTGRRPRRCWELADQVCGRRLAPFLRVAGQAASLVVSCAR